MEVLPITSLPELPLLLQLLLELETLKDRSVLPLLLRSGSTKLLARRERDVPPDTAGVVGVRERTGVHLSGTYISCCVPGE